MSLNNEKERLLEKTMIESVNLNNSIIEKNKDISKHQEKIEKLENLLKSKFELIEKYEKEITIKDKLNNGITKTNEKLVIDCKDISDRFTNLLSEYKYFKEINDHVLKENEMLKSKINLIENDNDIICQKNLDLEYLSNKLEEDLRSKEEHLTFFKDNFNLMKSKQDEIKKVVDNILQENEGLKLDLKEMQNIKEINVELINKIEKLKLEFQINEEDFKLLKETNEKLQNQVDNVFKIKIKALKFKLKEKIDILSQREREIDEIRKSKFQL